MGVTIDHRYVVCDAGLNHAASINVWKTVKIGQFRCSRSAHGFSSRTLYQNPMLKPFIIADMRKS